MKTLALAQALLDGVSLGAIYALTSVGLSLILGIVRVINFAHGEVLMIGMYLTYFLTIATGMNSYVFLILVIPVMFLFGMLMQRMIIQPIMNEPNMQLFATFGAMIFLQNLALAFTGGEYESIRNPAALINFSIGGLKITLPRLIILVAAVGSTILFQLLIMKTRIGRAMRSVVQDREAARLMGVNVEKIYLITFGLGTAITGLAAVLVIPLYSVFPGVGLYFVFASFVVVILGGMGSVPGALIGSFIIGVMEAFSGLVIEASLKQTFWFLLFIGILLFKPAGLFGIKGSEEVGLK